MSIRRYTYDPLNGSLTKRPDEELEEQTIPHGHASYGPGHSQENPEINGYSTKVHKLILAEYTAIPTEDIKEHDIYFILNEDEDKCIGIFVGSEPVSINSEYGQYGKHLYGNALFA